MANTFPHRGGCIYDDASDGDQLPGWYFWDETEAFYHGPFATEQEANAALITYARTL